MSQVGLIRTSEKKRDLGEKEPYLFNEAFSKGYGHGSYVIRQQLNELYPDKYIMETKVEWYDPIHFARMGQCKLTEKDKPLAQWQSFWSEDTFKGQINNTPLSIWYHVDWNDHSIDNLKITWIGDYGAIRHFILADTQEIAEEWVREVCSFNAKPGDAILCFDNGWWFRSQELHNAIKSTSLDDLVLKEGLRNHILDDITNFFQSKDIYARYKAPWKRGLILVGPPGNGKCLTSTDKITLANGKREIVGNLVNKRFKLITLNKDRLESTDAYAEFNTVEPVYSITTETGRKVLRNKEHPFWIANKHLRKWGGEKSVIEVLGWKSLGEIVEGQYVAVPIKLPAYGTDTTNKDELKVLAYLIGDGGIKVDCRFSQLRGPQLYEFYQSVMRLGCKVKRNKGSNNKNDYRVVGLAGKTNNHILKLLETHNLRGHGADTKFIPEFVFSLTPELQAVFLSRLYSTDGWASISKCGKRQIRQIGYCSNSEKLVRDIQELHLRFGIVSTVRKKTNKAWEVVVTRNLDILKFCDQIGIYGKEEAIAKIRAKVEQSLQRDKERNRIQDWRTRKAPFGMEWQKVKSISYEGESPTVSIEVPSTNTFVTNFWEHNSHFLKGLVNILNKDTTCLYVKTFAKESEPDQSQMRRVFSQARASAPCVLVLEDLDSLVTDKSRSFFLNEMDGFADNAGIFTVATTNHVEKLDPAITDRPSRFDRKYYLDLPSEVEREVYIRRWNDNLDDDLKIDDSCIKHLAIFTSDFSFAYLKELFISSIVAWLHSDGKYPFSQKLDQQVVALRESMKHEKELEAKKEVKKKEEEEEVKT